MSTFPVVVYNRLHDEISVGAAGKHGCPEFLDHHGRFDEGRAESAANAVWPVAMVAHGIVAPEAVIGALPGVRKAAELCDCSRRNSSLSSAGIE